MSDRFFQIFLFFIGHITVPTCSMAPGANMYSRSSAIALNWTQVVYNNYTALSTMPTLIFGFSFTGATGYNYLDDVSVVDNSAPSIQLLNNPSFENSTTNLTGWTTWCGNVTYCGGTNFPGQVLANSSCHSGNCYYDHCKNNYDYLSQSFPATIGDNYTISFWFQQLGTGTMKFYAEILN